MRQHWSISQTNKFRKIASSEARDTPKNGKRLFCVIEYLPRHFSPLAEIPGSLELLENSLTYEGIQWRKIIQCILMSRYKLRLQEVKMKCRVVAVKCYPLLHRSAYYFHVCILLLHRSAYYFHVLSKKISYYYALKKKVNLIDLYCHYFSSPPRLLSSFRVDSKIEFRQSWCYESRLCQEIYRRTSVARTLIACYPGLFRTRSGVPWNPGKTHSCRFGTIQGEFLFFYIEKIYH